MHRKELNEEFYFTEIIGTNGEVIVPAKKYRTADTDRESINKRYEDFKMLDENGDALIFPIPLDQYLRRK